MTGRLRVHLIVGAEFHDADFVRRELLALLGENELVEVSCDGHWGNVAALDQALMLVTFTSNLFPDDAQRARLQHFLRNGGRWLAIHGSAACTAFKPPAVNIGGIMLPGLTDTPDDQPEFMDLLGCRFVSHLALQEIEILAVSQHPLVAGIPPFKITDEPYVLEMRSACEVLLESRYTGEAPGYVEGPWLNDLPRPQALLHKVGDGEVLYLAPGHASGRYDLRPFVQEIPVQRGPWTNPAFREILARAIRWGTGQTLISTQSPSIAVR
jgi:uncharacterized protein